MINKALAHNKARVFYCCSNPSSHVIHRTSSSMNFFGVQMENAFAYEITMKYISFYNNSYNPADFLPNSRIGRNHLLVISSTFGLLSARAVIPHITT